MREKLGESESQKPREGNIPGGGGQGNCEWKSCRSRLAAGSSEVPCAEAGVRLGCGTVEGEMRKPAGGGSGRRDYRPHSDSGFGRDFSRPPPAICFEVKD